MSYEEELRRSTPTKEELEERKRVNHEEDLKNKARTAAQNFKTVCKNWASQGATSCWSYIGEYIKSNGLSLDGIYCFGEKEIFIDGFFCHRLDMEDLDKFLVMFNNELKSAGFEHANIHVNDFCEPIRVKRGFRFYTEQELIGKIPIVMANW